MYLSSKSENEREENKEPYGSKRRTSQHLALASLTFFTYLLALEERRKKIEIQVKIRAEIFFLVVVKCNQFKLDQHATAFRLINKTLLPLIHK